MSRMIKIVAVVLVFGFIVGLLCKHFIFTDQRKIRKTMQRLQEEVSQPYTGNGLDLAVYANTLKKYFANEVQIDIQDPSYGALQLNGRDELIQVAVAGRQANPQVKFIFSNEQLSILQKGKSAMLTLTVTAERANEPINPQNLVFLLAKSDKGDWQIIRIEHAARNAAQP
ncbi:MAG: hypothetical protein LBH01_08985 [Verrucomicrobiales bacterium]|nr:hypothetical protein [Verrucomicrobiales bacterium]